MNSNQNKFDYYKGKKDLKISCETFRKDAMKIVYCKKNSTITTQIAQIKC